MIGHETADRTCVGKGSMFLVCEQYSAAMQRCPLSVAVVINSFWFHEAKVSVPGASNQLDD